MRILNGIRSALFSSLSNYDRYRRDGYDDLITKNLGLTLDSNVVEIGGYLGDWSSQMFNLYGCNLQVFEPVPEYFEVLEKKFSECQNVSLFNFGLSSECQIVNFGIDGPSTGSTSVGKLVQVELKAVREVIDILPLKIDVMALNIEGGEYSLIPEFHRNNLLSRCEIIFVQFHQIDDRSRHSRQICQSLLSQTHTVLWSYDFVWEAWQRKKAFLSDD